MDTTQVGSAPGMGGPNQIDNTCLTGEVRNY